MDDGLWSPARRTLTGGLVLTITLVAFEALAISTVMPVVARELGGLDLYGWVFSAFLLGNLVGIVAVGGLIDRGGLVGPFVGGLLLFGIGLAIGGASPTMPILVAGRLLQGFGAGAIAPTAYVAIGRTLPEHLRAQMFATLSTAWVLPGVIGPVIAGRIAEISSWRFVFLGLIPLIVLSGSLAVVGLRQVPAADHASAKEHQAAAASMRRLPRAIVLAVGAALTVAGLSSPLPLPGVALVAVGLVLAVPAFRDLVPAGTLRARGRLPSAVLLRGLATFTFFSVDAYISLLLVEWRGLTPSEAGIALTAGTLTWTAGAWVQARRVGRYGAARFVGVGLATVVLGIAAISLVLIPAVPVAWAVPAFAIAGLGMGLAYAPLTLVVLAEADPAAVGAATAGLQLSDTLGTAVGTGVAGAIVAVAARSGAPIWVGLAIAFAMAMVVGILGVAISPRLRSVRAPAGDIGAPLR